MKTAKMKNLTVRTKEKLNIGESYSLAELPDMVEFRFNGIIYRTITYPKYGTMNHRQKAREVLNISSNKTEFLKYGSDVLVIGI